jgi:exodeoxyribonuclease V beta subunit
VQTKLPPKRRGIRFVAARPEHCLRELEFYFPLKNLSPAKLLSVLESRSADERRTLHFPPVQGFLKGFIDLVFEYEGRFYLADWKSNDLGGRPENYEPEGLRREMMKAFYDAQYLIYTVALDAYLEKRKPNYIYDRDFGGVFYFFLRGLAAPPRKGGVFYDRPVGAFIAGLKAALLAF